MTTAHANPSPALTGTSASARPQSSSPCLALAIFAWNEEQTIGTTLQSLFEQSLFFELSRLHQHCQIICVTNGCTDRTAAVASAFFEQQQREHPFKTAFTCSVADLPQPGKVNAWNQFVHALSAPSARVLFMTDADILIHRAETLWNMFQVLEKEPQASVAVDRPCKHLAFKRRKSWRDRLSLCMSRMTTAAEAQLCGQLYCIRSEIARNIYMPRDLAACEDGFIKALVCTDFLTHEVRPERVRLAPGAEHTFEAYTSPLAILRNQKRQIIGQTMVHLLVDTELNALPLGKRRQFARTLQLRENADPPWLKRLVSEHLRSIRHFWQLYPGLIGQRVKRLQTVHGLTRLSSLPAALAAEFASLIASFLAWRWLKAGYVAYWPKARRFGMQPAQAGSAPVPEFPHPQPSVQS